MKYHYDDVKLAPLSFREQNQRKREFLRQKWEGLEHRRKLRVEFYHKAIAGACASSDQDTTTEAKEKQSDVVEDQAKTSIREEELTHRPLSGNTLPPASD